MGSHAVNDTYRPPARSRDAKKNTTQSVPPSPQLRSDDGKPHSPKFSSATLAPPSIPNWYKCSARPARGRPEYSVSGAHATPRPPRGHRVNSTAIFNSTPGEMPVARRVPNAREEAGGGRDSTRGHSPQHRSWITNGRVEKNKRTLIHRARDGACVVSFLLHSFSFVPGGQPKQTGGNSCRRREVR